LRLVLPALLTSVIATAPHLLFCPTRRPISLLASIVRSLTSPWLFSSDPLPVLCQSCSCERSHGPIETGRDAGGWWLRYWRLDCSGFYRSRFHNCSETARRSLSWRSRTSFRSHFFWCCSFLNPLRPCCAWAAVVPGGLFTPSLALGA